MRNLWNRISYLGLHSKNIEFDKRIIILTNRLNFILVIIFATLFIISYHIALSDNHRLTFAVYKILLQVFICIINIYIAYKGYHKLVRIILAYSLLIVLIIIPIFIGEVRDDNYLYFPYSIILFHFISILLLNLKDEKREFILSFILSLVTLLFIEKLISYFGSEDLLLPGTLKDYLLYNKIIQLSMFVFISVAVFYLKNLNIVYEKELFQKNDRLDKQNEELKVTMENLRHTQQQLVQSARMASLGTFAAGVAHEINNPLNYIIGGIELLRKRVQKLGPKKNDNPELAELIDSMGVFQTMIYEGVNRASKIVKSLMVFSSTGKSKAALTDVNKVVDESLHLLNFKILDSISIITDFDNNAITFAYPDKLLMIFLAVLENAVYATLNSNKYDKRIEIRTRLIQGQKIRIEILNTGDHISTDDLEHIFDPFFTNKDPGEGAGLGLSIAYALIKEHNGNIKASNLRNGVKIDIEVPIKDKAGFANREV